MEDHVGDISLPRHQVAELTQDSVVATLLSGVKKSTGQFHMIWEGRRQPEISKYVPS